ncbi:MAG: hypothetical protein ACFFD4_37945, partial [Candidatus Odinarchaeota archaeon]
SNMALLTNQPDQIGLHKEFLDGLQTQRRLNRVIYERLIIQPFQKMLVSKFKKEYFPVLHEIREKLVKSLPTTSKEMEKVEKVLISVLGRTLGDHMLEKVKKSVNFTEIGDSNKIDVFFETMEYYLTKRLNKSQAQQLTKQMRELL